MLSKIIALSLRQALFDVSREVCLKTVANMKRSLLKLFHLISVLLVVCESEQVVGSLIVVLRTLVTNIHGLQKQSHPCISSCISHFPGSQEQDIFQICRMMFQKGT